MAGKRTDWDFALRIRGVTPRTLPMARLADYLKAWAVLLGDVNEPQFAGIVNGSAVLRASACGRRFSTHAGSAPMPSAPGRSAS